MRRSAPVFAFSPLTEESKKKASSFCIIYLVLSASVRILTWEIPRCGYRSFLFHYLFLPIKKFDVCNRN